MTNATDLWIKPEKRLQQDLSQLPWRSVRVWGWMRRSPYVCNPQRKSASSNTNQTAAKRWRLQVCTFTIMWPIAVSRISRNSTKLAASRNSTTCKCGAVGGIPLFETWSWWKGTSLGALPCRCEWIHQNTKGGGASFIFTKRMTQIISHICCRMNNTEKEQPG